MRYLTAGESHGKALVGILEGMPPHVKIDVALINGQLRRRQEGYGRGGRMAIETDTAEILSGVRDGVTTGSPIAIIINNTDYDPNPKPLTAVRPGHADLAGCIKYGFTDARNVAERASARETAMRTAIGAVCRQYLESKGITISSEAIEDNGLIDEARTDGDTLGGRVTITIKGVPAGLGSYVHYDRKLDGILAGQLMSIQSVKAVEIGLGTKCADMRGSEFHDKICFADDKFCRKTNNAGGIEGGMSNGEDIVITLTFKPIPTLGKGSDTVDIATGKPVKAAEERADVCVVSAGAVVAENVAAFVIASQLA